MKAKIVLLILFLSINLMATQFKTFSSKKSKENIQSQCKLTFLRSPSIVFRNENISRYGYFFVNHNLSPSYEVPLYIQNLLVSNNLQHIPHTNINVVFDKTIKIKLSDFIRAYVFLKNGYHSIYLDIDEERSSVKVGTARVEFNLITNCI